MQLVDGVHTLTLSLTLSVTHTGHNKPTHVRAPAPWQTPTPSNRASGRLTARPRPGATPPRPRAPARPARSRGELGDVAQVHLFDRLLGDVADHEYGGDGGEDADDDQRGRQVHAAVQRLPAERAR